MLRGWPARALGSASPLCSAPSAQLVYRLDGTARPCRAVIPDTVVDPHADLPTLFADPAFEQLRDDMRQSRLRRDVCGRCVHRIESGIPASAALVREVGDLRPANATEGPRRLVVMLDAKSPTETDATVARITPLLPRLEQLELVAADPLAHSVARALFASIAKDASSATATPTAVVLHCHRLPPASELQAALGGARVARVVVEHGPHAGETLAAAASLAPSDGIELRIGLGAENWFDLLPALRLASSHGAALRTAVLDDVATTPLHALGVPELGFVLAQWTGLWSLLHAPDHPTALTGGLVDELLGELRTIANDRAAAWRWKDAQRGLTGEALLTLPPLGHEWFAVDGHVDAFVRGVLALPAVVVLRAWFDATPLQTTIRAGRDAAWLRILLLKVAVETTDRRHRLAVRRLYQGTAGRARLNDDLTTAAAIGVEAHVRGWHRDLDLAALSHPRQRFVIPEPIAPLAAPNAAAAPRVTVLIPSYRHEAYIEAAMRSVLAQDAPDFVLAVVDDRSPDATVERARSVVDPRVTVAVNERNLGLGNGVLNALANVTTPFVALLNSDDLFHPERLRRCLDALTATPGAAVACTGLVLVDRRGNVLDADSVSVLREGQMIRDWVRWYGNALPDELTGTALFEELLRHNFLATSSNIVCRTDFLHAQAEALRDLKYCLDWQIFLEAARQGVMVYLPDALAAYRLHGHNTVWFRHDTRWRYTVEVNRVAALAVHRYLHDGDGDEHDRRVAALHAIADSLTTNTEVHGYGLYLAELFGGRWLEEHGAEDESTRTFVAALARRADRTSSIHHLLTAHGEALAGYLSRLSELPRLDLERWLGELRAEENNALRGRAEWLTGLWQESVDLLEAARTDFANERDRLLEFQRAVDTRLHVLGERVAALAAGFGERHLPQASDPSGTIDHVNREIERLEQLAHHLEHARVESARRRERLQDEVTALRADVDELVRGRETLRAEMAELEREFVVTTDRLKAERDAVESDLRDRDAALAAARTESAATQVALDEARAAAERERQALLHSREWRTGSLIWNRVPGLRKTSRLAKESVRQSRDAFGRIATNVRRRLGRSAGPRVVVAVDREFPSWPDTDALQQMQSLRDAGYAIRVFCWSRGGAACMPAAFASLLDVTTVLQSSHAIHRRDYRRYARRMPARVGALMQEIASRTGRTVADLEQDYEVLRAFTFVRHVESEGADYVHTWGFDGATFAAFVAARLLQVPHGMTCGVDPASRGDAALVQTQLRSADVVVAPSLRLRARLLAVAGGEIEPRLVFRPNAVDARRWQPKRAPARTDVAARFELVAVSRFAPRNGLDVLFAAVAALRDRSRAVRLRVAGKADPRIAGAEAHALRLQTVRDDLRLRAEIEMHGYLLPDAVAELLRGSDAFVAPAVDIAGASADAVPTAMLEAMASGLPIVCTDAGSLREAVTDGVEGLVVHQRDPAALADAIDRLIADRDLAARLGAAARARVEREFDIAVTERRWLERIAAVLAARRAAPRADG